MLLFSFAICRYFFPFYFVWNENNSIRSCSEKEERVQEAKKRKNNIINFLFKAFFLLLLFRLSLLNKHSHLSFLYSAATVSKQGSGEGKINKSLNIQNNLAFSRCLFCIFFLRPHLLFLFLPVPINFFFSFFCISWMESLKF